MYCYSLASADANADLARLKEYVAGMSGGLDAKVYEGGKIHPQLPFLQADSNCDANALQGQISVKARNSWCR